MNAQLVNALALKATDKYFTYTAINNHSTDTIRRRGVVVNALFAINEVTLRRARLLLGWVTVCGQVNHLGM